jgi:hypothetical protein
MKLILLFKKIKGFLDKKKKLCTPCKYAIGEELWGCPCGVFII